MKIVLERVKVFCKNSAPAHPALVLLIKILLRILVVPFAHSAPPPAFATVIVLSIKVTPSSRLKPFAHSAPPPSPFATLPMNVVFVIAIGVLDWLPHTAPPPLLSAVLLRKTVPVIEAEFPCAQMAPPEFALLRSNRPPVTVTGPNTAPPIVLLVLLIKSVLFNMIGLLLKIAPPGPLPLPFSKWLSETLSGPPLTKMVPPVLPVLLRKMVLVIVAAPLLTKITPPESFEVVWTKELLLTFTPPPLLNAPAPDPPELLMNCEPMISNALCE